MAKIYRGWIEGDPKEAGVLTGIGVKLGPLDEKLKLWSACEVSPEAMEKLDGLWGQFIWGLDPVEV